VRSVTPEKAEQSSRVRSEISRLFAAAATTYGLNLVSTLPSIAIVYFSTRVFAPDVMGQLTIIITVGSVIQSIGFSWLTSAQLRFGREEYIQSGGVRQTFRVRTVLLGTIWFVTMVSFAAFYFFIQNRFGIRLGLSGRVLWAVPVFLTVWVLAAELNGYLRVLGKYVELAAVSLVGQLFWLAGYLLLYTYLGPAGIDWLIVLSLGGSVVQSLYLILWLRPDDFRLGSTASRFKDTLRRTVLYSAPAIATSILGYLSTPIELYLIYYFVSVSAVGLFNTANNMNGLFVQFVILFPNLMFPILQGLKTTEKREIVQKYYQRIVPQLTILFALVVSIALVLLPPLMRLLLSQKYYLAIGPLLILACGEIPHMASALESVYPATYDKLSQSFWVTALNYGVGIACYLVLIPRIGIEGAAWGWVASYLAGALLLNWFVSKEFGAFAKVSLSIGLAVLIGLVSLSLALTSISYVIQILGLVGLLAASLILLRITRLFEYRDVKLLMATGIPRLLQPAIEFVYRLLG
jgi:O-antigen/teichoic acid export membrane protein